MVGVTCNHCHIFNGPGDPMNDFAGDTKPPKNIARAMMLMVREINPAVQKAVTSTAADQVAQVGCATCHRGAAIPVVAPGSPGAPPPPRGAGPGGPPPPGVLLHLERESNSTPKSQLPDFGELGV
jgi:mono/diheme cytochrome c family protein